LCFSASLFIVMVMGTTILDDAATLAELAHREYQAGSYDRAATGDLMASLLACAGVAAQFHHRCQELLSA